MNLRQLLTMFAILLAVPGIAAAQPPGGGRGPGGPGGRGPAEQHGHGLGGPPLEMMSRMFDQIDADGDGSITKAELEVALKNERRGTGKPRGQGGPPPKPGQVLPDFVADSLSMTAEQKDQLAKLQADVDKRLAAILTKEQKQEMEDHHARGPHGEDGPPRDRQRRDRGKDRGSDRPDRPRRPQ